MTAQTTSLEEARRRLRRAGLRVSAVAVATAVTLGGASQVFPTHAAAAPASGPGDAASNPDDAKSKRIQRLRERLLRLSVTFDEFTKRPGIKQGYSLAWKTIESNSLTPSTREWIEWALENYSDAKDYYNDYLEKRHKTNLNRIIADTQQEINQRRQDLSNAKKNGEKTSQLTRRIRELERRREAAKTALRQVQTQLGKAEDYRTQAAKVRDPEEKARLRAKARQAQKDAHSIARSAMQRGTSGNDTDGKGGPGRGEPGSSPRGAKPPKPPKGGTGGTAKTVSRATPTSKTTGKTTSKKVTGKGTTTSTATGRSTGKGTATGKTTGKTTTSTATGKTTGKGTTTSTTTGKTTGKATTTSRPAGKTTGRSTTSTTTTSTATGKTTGKTATTGKTTTARTTTAETTGKTTTTTTSQSGSTRSTVSATTGGRRITVPSGKTPTIPRGAVSRGSGIGIGNGVAPPYSATEAIEHPELGLAFGLAQTLAEAEQTGNPKDLQTLEDRIKRYQLPNPKVRTAFLRALRETYPSRIVSDGKGGTVEAVNPIRTRWEKYIAENYPNRDNAARDQALATTRGSTKEAKATKEALRQQERDKAFDALAQDKKQSYARSTSTNTKPAASKKSKAAIQKERDKAMDALAQDKKQSYAKADAAVQKERDKAMDALAQDKKQSYAKTTNQTSGSTSTKPTTKKQQSKKQTSKAAIQKERDKAMDALAQDKKAVSAKTTK